MSAEFDVEIVAVLAEGLADAAGRGDVFRAEADDGQQVFPSIHLDFTLKAQAALVHARQAGLELVKAAR